MYDSNPYFYGTGRRKSSVARVRLVPGNGQIVVNGKDSKDYLDPCHECLNNPVNTNSRKPVNYKEKETKKKESK